MSLPRLLIITHTNLGDSLSGGDRIFLNIIRYWKNKFQITTLASKEASTLIKRHHHSCNIQLTTTNPTSAKLSTFNLVAHHFRRLISGLLFCLRHKKYFVNTDYIYTASDFYGDFIFGLMAKIYNPKIIWLCGYYLLAPSPLAPTSPYNTGHHRLRGLIYFLAQLPTIFLARHFANFVFVTSTPDTKIFTNKSIIVQGGVYIPSQSEIKQLPPLIQRHYDAFYLGRLHAQKGVLEMIDIWKLVCRQLPHAKLVIVGDGELMLALKTKIKQLRLQSNIKLIGFLIGSRKFSLIKNSKIVLHPATYDSGGMAAAEAMAWGLPGVSFDLPALKTYYPKGMIKIPPYDFQQFADSIYKLLTNPTFYQDYSRQARSLTVQNWNWKTRLQSIYHQII